MKHHYSVSASSKISMIERIENGFEFALNRFESLGKFQKTMISIFAMTVLFLFALATYYAITTKIF